MLGTIWNNFFSSKIRQTPKMKPPPFHILITEKCTVHHSSPDTVSVFGDVNCMIWKRLVWELWEYNLTEPYLCDCMVHHIISFVCNMYVLTMGIFLVKDPIFSHLFFLWNKSLVSDHSEKQRKSAKEILVSQHYLSGHSIIVLMARWTLWSVKLTLCFIIQSVQVREEANDS